MIEILKLFESMDMALEPISNFLPVISAFFVIFSALECFFGYKLFRIQTAIIGFLVGGIIGLIAGAIIGGGWTGAWIGFFVVGVLGAWLSFKLYKLAVFIGGFFWGGLIGLVIGLAIGNSEVATLLIPLFGIALGVLGVILTKPIIMISTGLGGGIAIGEFFSMNLGSRGLGIFLGAMIGLLGIFLQFWMDKEASAKPLQSAAIPEKAGAPQTNLKFSILKTRGETGTRISNSTKALISNVKEQLIPTIVTTRSAHKCEGCKILAKNSTPLRADGLPIVVTETYIISSENEAGAALLLGFQNLSSQTVVAACFSFKCFNLFQQELKPVEKLVVQDIALHTGEVWFSDTPYSFPDADTRRIEVTVQTIAAENGNIWSNENGVVLSPLPEQKRLDLPKELADELPRLGADYQSKYNPRVVCVYQPQDFGSYWNCTCGQLNTGETCIVCGLNKSAVFELTKPEFLRQRRELRLSEQKRLEEERRQKIAEHAQEVKEGAGKVAQKSLETVQKGYRKSVTYGNRGIQKLADVWKRLKERLHNFYTNKIQPNKKKIIVISGAVVCVVLVLVVGLVGFQKYQAYQREQEAIRLAQQQAEEEAARLEAERKREQERLEREQALRLEYEQIIDESPLYNGLTSGLIYADYLDMNQDGTQELLLLSATSGEIDTSSTITIQLYASRAETVDLCKEISIDLMGGKADTRISLYQKENALYLRTYMCDEASLQPTEIAYYAFDGSSLILKDQISSVFSWVDGEERRDTIYSPENAQETMAQYTLMEDLFTYNNYSGATFSRGILPEPELSPDIQRRIALLDVLKQTDNILYAKLVDINGDGQEDLLTLYETAQANMGIMLYFFRAYIWDGQQVNSVDFSQTGDEMLDSYLQTGFDTYGLYQNNENGNLYVCYDGEIVGGWGGTLFIGLSNPVDYEFCPYPHIASDYSPELYTEEENMELEAQYAEEEAAYQLFMSRYQLVEQAYQRWGAQESEESEDVIQSVIQQLENV